MKYLDTDLTYRVGDRTEKCHLRLHEHAGKTVAVISDMPKHAVDQVFDDTTSLFEGITRQFEIPIDQYTQILHFAPIPEAGVPERFSLFFPGVSVGRSVDSQRITGVQVAGRMLALELAALEEMIGEKW